MTDFPLVWDSTMVAALSSCQWKANLEYVEHWKPKGISVHLHAGAAFARGLEVARKTFYEEGKRLEDGVAAGVGALLTYYGNFDAGNSPKTAIRMAGALEFYFSHYPMDQDTLQPIKLPNGKYAIEFSFADPLPVQHPTTGDPLIYAGRSDLIGKYGDAGNFIDDEKTTTQLGESWTRQWDLRGQFTGYCRAARNAGIPVQGAIVRGVSILKTKYDTLEVITYRPQWQVDRWLKQTCAKLERAKVAWAHGEWEMALDHACTEYGGCPFKQTCLSEDPNPWLESGFERRFWNPLTREEEKV
jgi:hypothetical protein